VYTESLGKPLMEIPIKPLYNSASKEYISARNSVIGALQTFPRPRPADIALALVVALLSGLFMYYLAFYPPSSLRQVDDDVWFGADLARVQSTMTDWQGLHYRTGVHPIGSLVTFVPVQFLRKILGLRIDRAVDTAIGIYAALWACLLFISVRMVRLPRLESVLITCIGLVSSTSLFLFSVPETYVLSSTSILLACVLAFLPTYFQNREFVITAASAASLSLTVTNWMFGLFLAIFRLPLRRAIQVSINAFFIVAVLWSVQGVLVKGTRFFTTPTEERHYIYAPKPARIAAVAHAIAISSVIAGPIRTTEYRDGLEPAQPLKYPVALSLRGSLPPLHDYLGWSAIAAWIAVLIVSAWKLWQAIESWPYLVLLVLPLAGNFAMHLVYGTEPFLYGGNWTVYLFLLAALGLAKAPRAVSISLLLLCLLTAGMNNRRAYWSSLATLMPYGSERDKAEQMMKFYPRRAWPRGVSHAIIAWPGSAAGQKGYMESGGSFSPGPGSFGVSVWIGSRESGPSLTSDSIPIEEITQSFETTGGPLPKVAVQTPYYHLSWTAASDSAFILDLAIAAGSAAGLAVRSTGPTGGPITALMLEESTLLVNNRWAIEGDFRSDAAYLGEESRGAWAQIKGNHWSGASGWGYAVIPLKSGATQRFVIRDRAASAPSALPFPGPADSVMRIASPNRRFNDSAAAQRAHLLMGLVSGETRPGDPWNYTFEWSRDGAYIVSAVARSGDLGVARALAKSFADRDFFGGFGAEADAPGLGIWTLSEVSKALHDESFDRQIWPAVRRKADLIVQLKNLKTVLKIRPPGPLVPAWANHKDIDVVAWPASDGLIQGRMDFHRPLAFINAVSYRGLLEACRLGARVGEASISREYCRQAADLQIAWTSTLGLEWEARNERTASSALWPTGVGLTSKDRIRVILDQNWNRHWLRPGAPLSRLWTYFDIGEAHQWLWLGDPARAWRILDWYLGNSVAPGLYAWWEGEGEENTTGLYEHVRGWVRPKYVTPHYWTAAEVLLLQFEMLAMTDPDNTESVILGAGISPDWIQAPFEAHNVGTGEYRVSFKWDGRSVTAMITGGRPAVRLGPAFPVSASINVSYQ
jgi:hypothetical protein